MKRIVCLILFLIVVVACQPYKVKKYTHPEYGVGGMENEFYARDVEACKNEVYGKGIFVDSQKVTDLGEIGKLDAEYSEWLKNEAIAAVKERRSMGYVPVKYQDLDRARVESGECLKNKGWKK